MNNAPLSCVGEGTLIKGITKICTHASCPKVTWVTACVHSGGNHAPGVIRTSEMKRKTDATIWGLKPYCKCSALVIIGVID
ncbi:hypothetical protein CEXT_359811 [Caerostris extrusa]|uniref:PAAR domain-containing protein n=1 Tax=Caerostris extrusa TaxID=172846 RepID=A0AAV4SCV9_CAEEX|nr:hypothetical protein CEXT_359811 [Caerostris extrusa]